MTTPMRAVLFTGYLVGLAALYAGPIQALIDLSRTNPTASHVVLVPLVSVALVMLKRRAIFSSTAWGWRAGSAVIAAGAALGFYGRGLEGDALSVTTAGLVVATIGGFLLIFGRAATRAALFPLAFLLFAVPIPGVVLAHLILYLKKGSTAAVASLFDLTTTPYHRDGFVFALPAFNIEIADECSGIRSSIALLLTALLAGHLFLRSGWKQALLVAVTFPVAILKNGIRITTLSLLASHVDARYLTGQLHHEGGIVFYVITLGLLAPIFLVLKNSERVLQKENS